MFFRSVGAGWIISNGLKIAAYPTSSLDAGALAAYLLNGIPLGGQTLFRDVHVLPEGTIARLTSGDLDIKPYWSYEIDESFEGRSERKLVAEFGELLFSGISARLRQDPRAMFLSLSGGYDSTCILASALRVLGPKNIRAFSYETRDARTTDADAKIAAEVCRHWKVDHRTIQIPTRSLSEIVESNARHAFATANPCLELAVWETLDQSLGFTSGTPRLFFGDNAFGHDPNWRLSTREDAMAWLPMPMLDDFNQLRPFLKDTEFEPTKNSFAEVLGKVLQRGATVYDPMNVKDFFYFDSACPLRTDVLAGTLLRTARTTGESTPGRARFGFLSARSSRISETTQTLSNDGRSDVSGVSSAETSYLSGVLALHPFFASGGCRMGPRADSVFAP